MILKNEQNEIKQILSQKKEQFAVEIRRRKNQCQIEKNRQIIALKFNENIHTRYEETNAAQIYEQIVKEYSQQNNQSGIDSSPSILLTDEEFQLHLNNLENYTGNIQFYCILKSLIYINAYLRMNNMSRINISQKMIDNLADISVTYENQQTSENYYLSIMALQSISVISYFPINVDLFSEKLFKSLFTWVDSNMIQLQCNSFQAIYLVSCSDESIMQKLIVQYDLLNISLNALKNTISRLKSIVSSKSSKKLNSQNNLEEVLRQLVLQIIRIVQDYQILTMKSNSRLDHLHFNELLIEAASKILLEHSVVDISSSIICGQIIKLSLNSEITFEITLKNIINSNIIPIFYEIIGKYVMNYTESKSYQQLVETITNIICIISSCDDQNISQIVYQSNSNLSILIDLLIKERSKINITSLKIIHNICFDNPFAQNYVIESNAFWQNLGLIISYSSSQELVKEILLLLFQMVEQVTNNIANKFIEQNGFQIIYQILYKFQTPQFIIISFDILNALFDYIIEEKIDQNLEKFTQQCSKFQIIQLAESFCSNHQIQNNVQNSIFYFLNKLDTHSDFLKSQNNFAITENIQFNSFKLTPASFVYQNYN
ncbi:hypothetical protein TTHERM_01444890 (macronuclear) [Tetrahymena thermophila SB210]|uniref:Uncharacterized protein n=1 Tax=Tetrahymena thermophila (strain SB210) TaxID=312017 RepID=Q229B3_TETTS|nr:hypothetical protein TTHERM_01444890 [Tetrahymena thermophila SB210]EAR81880.3 hypothetical protein TTHERM_01444890 [Tetrahymena thermophila SB210]|eukprot:XP_001029543.3 hypothetical protein TTHERM_01444890 [Tetrahymena thermophila SB210]